MTTANSVRLPDHPGDLIRLAVLDLVATAKDRRFKINMDEWFQPSNSGEGPCEVCFAGAVMAKSLCVAPTQSYYRTPFGEDSERKFSALNSFRDGDIADAYRYLWRAMPNELPVTTIVVPWEEDRNLFLADMLDLAHRIDEAEGQ